MSEQKPSTRRSRPRESITIQIDASYADEVRKMAERTGLPLDEVIEKMLSFAMLEYHEHGVKRIFPEPLVDDSSQADN
jgi:hypothetical protein